MYQIRPVVRPTLYRVEGEGPMGFAVRGRSSIPSDTPAKSVGTLARARKWAELSEVAMIAGRSPLELIEQFGLRGTLAQDLWVLQPDMEAGAVGGHLMIRGLWHNGHRRRYLDVGSAYVPYEWAEAVLEEILKPAEAVPRQS